MPRGTCISRQRRTPRLSPTRRAHHSPQAAFHPMKKPKANFLRTRLARSLVDYDQSGALAARAPDHARVAKIPLSALPPSPTNQFLAVDGGIARRICQSG